MISDNQVDQGQELGLGFRVSCQDQSQGLGLGVMVWGQCLRLKLRIPVSLMVMGYMVWVRVMSQVSVRIMFDQRHTQWTIYKKIGRFSRCDSTLVIKTSDDIEVYGHDDDKQHQKVFTIRRHVAHKIVGHGETSHGNQHPTSLGIRKLGIRECWLMDDIIMSTIICGLLMKN